MLSSLTFFAGSIAAAGAVAALGPVVIHLLNRRRHRVVHWAAMDFLREALSRNRRIVELRDIVLLLLRTACVLLLGLALARPHFADRTTAADQGGPVHAVLVIDNSLSMAYERLDGTLLDAAKARARETLDRLPEGSRVSVIPLCSSAGEFSWDAYRTQDDALESLRAIEIVDRAGTASQAMERAQEACRAVSDLPTKRIVFIGDQQAANWPTDGLAAGGSSQPEMHVVAVSAENPENAWVAEFKLRDGLADTETDAQFLAVVHYEGASPRPNVLATLLIDGAEVGSRTIDLEPGQQREVAFTHRFVAPPEAGRAAFSAAEVRLSPDRLPADDRRALVVPVVAALPVVFIDQYGEDESPEKNQYGETFRLRRLLAPVTSRSEAGRQLVQVRRARIDQVDRELLADARLVVIAGVERPDAAVGILREYVLQGGQLFIAAGAAFDPAAWNRAAWLEGGGILAAPLQAERIGRAPDDPDRAADPFFLAFDSLSHDYFQLDDVPRDELAELYRLPFFFQAVAADADEAVAEATLRADLNRLQEQRRFLEESAARLTRWSEEEARGALTDEERAERTQDERRRDELSPHWLRWQADDSIVSPAAAQKGSDESHASQAAADPLMEMARAMRPRVLASYTNQAPFLVERKLGQGQTLLCTTGVHSDWSTLTKTNAVLLFDRIFRAALERTLPRRNLLSNELVRLPIEAEDRRARLLLRRPESDLDEPLLVEALGRDQFGVTVRNAATRGIYRVTALRPDTPSAESIESKWWEIPLAVNGPQQESQLAALDQAAWQTRIGDAPLRWVAPGEAISLDGVRVRGQDLWKWLLAAALGCLLLEMALLIFWSRRMDAALPAAVPARAAAPASPPRQEALT